MLKEVDAEYAATLHANNVKKVIRALEYFHETGEKLSVHNASQREKSSPYRFVYFVLNDKREVLYERINARVDAHDAGRPPGRSEKSGEGRLRKRACIHAGDWVQRVF